MENHITSVELDGIVGVADTMLKAPSGSLDVLYWFCLHGRDEIDCGEDSGVNAPSVK